MMMTTTTKRGGRRIMSTSTRYRVATVLLAMARLSQIQKFVAIPLQDPRTGRTNAVQLPSMDNAILDESCLKSFLWLGDA